MIPRKALWASWVQRLPVSTVSLIIENSLHSASMTFPVSMGRFTQLLVRKEREARQERKRQSRETVMQSWGKVLVPHQWIHTTISQSCFAGTETSSMCEELMIDDARVSISIQTPHQGDADDADFYFPHHQPIRRMPTSWSHPL